METKVYESRRQVTLKDGTVKEYITRSKYTPKGLKEVKKSDIIEILRHVDNRQNLKIIKEFISQFDERNQQPAENPRDPERN